MVNPFERSILGGLPGVELPVKRLVFSLGPNGRVDLGGCAIQRALRQTGVLVCNSAVLEQLFKLVFLAR